MEQVKRFEDIAELLTAQLKKGVVTNNFLSREDYAREIAGELLTHVFDGGLLLFRRRADYYVMNFYLQTGALPELPALALPVVTELVWRAKDAAAAELAAAQFCASGFSERFRRRRYQRTAQACAKGAAATVAVCAQADEIHVLMEENFDHFGGCIPPQNVLLQQISQGEILCTGDENGISGILHFARGRAASEIRHLAVRHDCRGAGLAGELLCAYLEATAYQKSQVWARQGNAPAERFYEKNQYRHDGWESAVLFAGGKDMA